MLRIINFKITLTIYIVSIMQVRPLTTTSPSFNVLKTNNQTILLSNNAPPLNHQTYSLLQTPRKTIRQYLLYCQNVQQFLSLAEWRHNASSNIVRSIYVKINEQTPLDRNVWIQYYTDHVELFLKDMNKLITAEALYCLVRILKGYSQLLQKFKKVSVNTETIGLNSDGECIVWINRHLQRNYPQYYAYYDEQAIIKTVVSLLKQKGQKACQNIMGKLQTYSLNKKTTIAQLLAYVQHLIHVRGIILPRNLKYLLRQKRIVKQLSSLDGERTNRCKNIKHFTQYNSQVTSGQLFAKRSETCYMISSTPAQRTFRNQKMNHMKRSSNVYQDGQRKKVDLKIYSTSQEKYSIKYKPRKGSYNMDSNFSKNNSRGSIEDCIRIINSKSNKSINSINSSKSVDKYFNGPSSEVKQFKLGKISQAQTASSMIDVKDSSLKVPKLATDDNVYSRAHNSIMSFLSKKSEDQIVPEEDKQSYESSSPEKCSDLSGYFGIRDSNRSHRSRKMANNSENIKDSGKIRQKLSDEFKERVTKPENTWIKNIDELCSVNIDMNASIVEGPEKYAYLEDVQLQGLDKLNNHLTQSEVNSCERIQL